MLITIAYVEDPRCRARADISQNWLGGQVVADEVKAKGFAAAGYTNIQTSDGITHGKNAPMCLDHFAGTRINAKD